MFAENFIQSESFRIKADKSVLFIQISYVKVNTNG